MVAEMLQPWASVTIKEGAYTPAAEKGWTIVESEPVFTTPSPKSQVYDRPFLPGALKLIDCAVQLMNLSAVNTGEEDFITTESTVV
jgi:hypothetical protein